MNGRAIALRIVAGLVCVSMLAAFGPAWAAPLPQSGQDYANPDWGFAISYPDGWELHVEPDWVVFSYDDGDDVAALAVIYGRDYADRRRTMAEVFERMRDQTSADVEDVVLEAAEPRTIGGRQADVNSFMATDPGNGASMVGRIFRVSVAGRGFGLWAVSHEDTWSDHEAEFEAMLDSIRLDITTEASPTRRRAGFMGSGPTPSLTATPTRRRGGFMGGGSTPSPTATPTRRRGGFMGGGSTPSPTPARTARPSPTRRPTATPTAGVEPLPTLAAGEQRFGKPAWGLTLAYPEGWTANDWGDTVDITLGDGSEDFAQLMVVQDPAYADLSLDDMLVDISDRVGLFSADGSVEPVEARSVAGQEAEAGSFTGEDFLSGPVFGHVYRFAVSGRTFGLVTVEAESNLAEYSLDFDLMLDSLQVGAAEPEPALLDTPVATEAPAMTETPIATDAPGPRPTWTPHPARQTPRATPSGTSGPSGLTGPSGPSGPTGPSLLDRPSG